MTTIIPHPTESNKQIRFESCEFGDRPVTYIKISYSVEKISSTGIVVEEIRTFQAESTDVSEWEQTLGQTIRTAIQTAMLNHFNSLNTNI